MADKFTFTVNGKQASINTEPDRPLLEVLREDLQLVGTRYGCGEGACGACSVLVDSKRIFSCSVPVSQVQGKTLTTIEGLTRSKALHPMQQAFLEEGAFQCAFCTSGMIIAAIALLDRNPNPSDQEIRDGMNGNICRCCVQPQILKAVRRASARLATSGR